MATTREHGLYSGPLLGWHQLIASVQIDNPTGQPLHLVSVAPAEPCNVIVEDAWAVPLHTADSAPDRSIVGVLRWPRDSRDDAGFNVLKHVSPAAGFTLPAHSHDQWMVTLRLRPKNVHRSMRTAGTTITYNLDGHDHTVTIPTRLCFTSNNDTQACPTDTGP